MFMDQYIETVAGDYASGVPEVAPNATLLTASAWPSKVATHSPDMFHNLTMLSYDPVKNSLQTMICE